MATHGRRARFATLAPALVVLCLAMAGCSWFSKKTPEAGNTPTPVISTSRGEPSTPPPTPPPTSAGPATGDVLGCGQFCQQAGGIGGSGEPGVVGPCTDMCNPNPYVAVVTKSANIIDGMLPVSIACTSGSPCEGGIVAYSSLQGFPRQLGKSDLLVPAHGTRTIAIPVDSIDNFLNAGVQVIDALIELYNGKSGDCSAQGTWCQTGAEATVALGPTKPDFAMSPVALVFPHTRPGDTAAIDVTVTNISTQSRTPKVSIDKRTNTYDYQRQAWGGDPTVFGVHEACTGRVLPVGGSCLITFEFHPTAYSDLMNLIIVDIDANGYEIGMIGVAADS